MDKEELIKDFYYNKLKFCGCGNPEDTLLFIKNLLNTIHKHWEIIKKNREHYYEYPEGEYERYQNELHSVFEFMDKKNEKTIMSDIQNGVMLFVLYTLDEAGILEHGGSVNSSWLSDYGEQIRECLNSIDNFEDII